jgi:hypothetical protein
MRDSGAQRVPPTDERSTIPWNGPARQRDGSTSGHDSACL